MLNSINALKMLVTAKALLSYVADCGFQSHAKSSSEEFDQAHSLFADTVELVGSSAAEHALQQVLATSGRFFSEQEIAFLRDYIEELKEEEEKA